MDYATHEIGPQVRPLLLSAELQDHLISASNDLDRLHTLLADACDTLMLRFNSANEQIKTLMDEHGRDADSPRAAEAYRGLVQQLGGAVIALQFQDMASQLIAHTHRRLRCCADTLAQDAFGDDDDDGYCVVEAAPLRPNPVTQSEMDAGSIELF
jgi:hypothetical protein